MKRRKKKKQSVVFKEQMDAGIRKYRQLKQWEAKKIITMAEQNRSVIVNYLIWHSWSKVGLVKFCSTLYFYMRMKLAEKEIQTVNDELTIWVDYGNEPNDYEKIGLIEMVKYHPNKGFEIIRNEE